MTATALRTLSMTGLLVSALIAAGPVSAHEYERHHGYGHGYGPRHFYAYRPVVVMPPAPVYYAPQAPVYYAPPAPAYYAPPAPAYYAQPVYYSRPVHLGAVGGAMAGAVIGSQLGYGNNRVAATAIGGAVGAILGDSLTRGR